MLNIHKNILIKDCIKTGAYYIDTIIIKGNWHINFYYHRSYALNIIITHEYAYDIFILRYSNGYTDYEKFAKENDYNLVEKLHSLI